MADKPISGLLITGFLAVFGTVAGSVVKGYWDNQLAQSKFQSELIMRALDPDETEARVASLQFLVTTNLITDPEIRSGLQSVIKKGGSSVPQFTRARSTTSEDGAKKALTEKFPTLAGKNVALIGFKVRHGDIIDSVTPIYANVSKQLNLIGEYEGKQIGGNGGDETRILKPGHVITQISVQRGIYFGGDRVAHFQVTWTPISSKGLDTSASVQSQKFGSGNNIRNLQATKVFKAEAGGFISDFNAEAGRHSIGDVFLRDLVVQETMVLKSD